MTRNTEKNTSDFPRLDNKPGFRGQLVERKLNVDRVYTPRQRIGTRRPSFTFRLDIVQS